MKLIKLENNNMKENGVVAGAGLIGGFIDYWMKINLPIGFWERAWDALIIGMIVAAGSVIAKEIAKILVVLIKKAIPKKVRDYFKKDDIKIDD